MLMMHLFHINTNQVVIVNGKEVRIWRNKIRSASNFLFACSLGLKIFYPPLQLTF